MAQNYRPDSSHPVAKQPSASDAHRKLIGTGWRAVAHQWVPLICPNAPKLVHNPCIHGLDGLKQLPKCEHTFSLLHGKSHSQPDSPVKIHASGRRLFAGVKTPAQVKVSEDRLTLHPQCFGDYQRRCFTP